jgi:hypothetical protein
MTEGVFFTKLNRRNPPPMPEPPLYRPFLTYVFENPDPEPSCWEEDPHGFGKRCDSRPAEIVALYLHLMRNLRKDLADFSLDQIACGVERLIHPGQSSLVFVLQNRAVAMSERCEAIRAMAQLYEDVFDLHCAPVMCHLDQPGGNRLNSVCYMWWDVTPINFYRTVVNRLDPEVRDDVRPIAEAVFSVLEQALYAENIVSVESGLHGLGHMACDWAKEVNAIINLYQRRRPNHDPRILRYADLARHGLVE